MEDNLLDKARKAYDLLRMEHMERSEEIEQLLSDNVECRKKMNQAANILIKELQFEHDPDPNEEPVAIKKSKHVKAKKHK